MGLVQRVTCDGCGRVTDLPEFEPPPAGWRVIDCTCPDGGGGCGRYWACCWPCVARVAELAEGLAADAADTEAVLAANAGAPATLVGDQLSATPETALGLELRAIARDALAAGDRQGGAHLVDVAGRAERGEHVDTLAPDLAPDLRDRALAAFARWQR